MFKRRTIKAALTAATIAAAIALPVGTASAATASPQVHTAVWIDFHYTLSLCDQEGKGYVSQGADSYACIWNSYRGGWDLWTYWS